MFVRTDWCSQCKQFDLVVGHADYLRRISRRHRRAVALGPRTSGTLLSHLYAAAVAQLAREGRFHYCGLHGCAGASLYRELGWIEIISDVVNVTRDSFIDSDGYLYGLSVCAGKGARHVAEPTTAAASLCPGDVVGFRSAIAVDCVA